jgi:hypothetical protein
MLKFNYPGAKTIDKEKTGDDEAVSDGINVRQLVLSPKAYMKRI